MYTLRNVRVEPFYFFYLFGSFDVYLFLQGFGMGCAGRWEPGRRAPSTVAGTGAMSSAPALRAPSRAVALSCISSTSIIFAGSSCSFLWGIQSVNVYLVI